MLIRWYPDKSLPDLIGKLKGRSSKVISRDRIASPYFRWATGYGAFSVSSWDVERISGYISRQEEHHRVRSLAETIEDLLREIEFLEASASGVGVKPGVEMFFCGAATPG